MGNCGGCYEHPTTSTKQGQGSHEATRPVLIQMMIDAAEFAFAFAFAFAFGFFIFFLLVSYTRVYGTWYFEIAL
jgi:hypothetical protein